MTAATDADRALIDALSLNPERSNIVVCLGMKGSGKSSAARMIFDAWPTDRVVIDPTGSARPDDPATVALAAPFPSAMPEPDPDANPPQDRVTVWARIDPASDTFEMDQDQAVRMALNPRHRRVLIWRDEYMLGTSAHKILAADRTLLTSSRHWNASAVLVSQRPRHIPTMTLSQADLVFVWSLPSPKDRAHVADNCGVTPALFDAVYRANRARDKHAYVLYDRRNDVLLDMPPLPGIKDRGPRA